MLKSEVVELFEDTILPGIPANDRPAKRMAWNNFVDGLQKGGQITEKQASTWGHPACVK